MSPTQRSLALLRERGYLVAVVERWNPYARVRQDLFQILDLLAVRGEETLGVQVTSDSHVAERVAKITQSDATSWLRRANWSLVVHGWRKRGRGWVCREVDVS